MDFLIDFMKANFCLYYSILRQGDNFSIPIFFFFFFSKEVQTEKNICLIQNMIAIERRKALTKKGFLLLSIVLQKDKYLHKKHKEPIAYPENSWC